MMVNRLEGLSSLVRQAGGNIAKTSRVGQAELLERHIIAQELIDIVGSADKSDFNVVYEQLVRLDIDLLRDLRDQGVRIKVCRDNITDYRTDLVGKISPYSGLPYEDAPIGGVTTGNEATVPTYESKLGNRFVDTEALYHEALHALSNTDPHGPTYDDPEFVEARNADYDALSDYEKQEGHSEETGRSETYAESGAEFLLGRLPGQSALPEEIVIFFGAGPTPQPHLLNFWEGTDYDPVEDIIETFVDHIDPSAPPTDQKPSPVRVDTRVRRRSTPAKPVDRVVRSGSIELGNQLKKSA